MFTELLVLMLCYLLCMLFLIQYKGDTSIANFTWGGGVMLTTLYTFFAMSSFTLRQCMLTILITLWASRLILHLYKRYTGNDPRFTTWKWQGFKALVINSIWIFGQSIMIAVMSYPILLVNTQSAQSFNYLDICGLIIWVIGYWCEVISDRQLRTFMHNPENKGHVLSTGLWRYSRHPNYFGEILMWWGIFIIAFSVPFGWTAIIAPGTITFLLLFVTGVPLLEKAMQNNPEYQKYKAKTSVLIPWFVTKQFRQ